jgi:myo-inositol-1(or 4)-monophosphatase
MDLRSLVTPIESVLRATRPKVLQAYRREAAPARFKDDGSAITDLDHELERDISAALLQLDDTWGVCGEESGTIRAGTPTWHLDPVDGTANFSRRVGVFGSQLALVDGLDPLFAAIYEPLLDEFTWAAKGLGTWHEGRRMQMPDRPRKHALVCVDISSSGLFADQPDLLIRLRKGTYKTRALGSVAIHMRDVAIGAADGYLGGRTNVTPLHDLAPGTLLVREAGGLVTDAQGEDAMLERRILVAGSPQVHGWMCQLVTTPGM